MRVAFLVCAAAVLFAAPIEAGQVRVNVSSNFFSDGTVPLNSTPINAGDHVVWIWTGGFHTVTSGNPVTGVADGIFDSGTSALSNAQFTWRDLTPSAGDIPYFCRPHRPGMAGTVQVTSGISVPSFRISEVYFGAPGDQDFIEIANLGAASGDLASYRVSIAPGTPLTIQLANVVVPVGGRVVLRLNQAGAPTQTEQFFPGVTLARTGSVALYVPNTVTTSLADVTQIVDFVQWGAGNQTNQATANAASYWTGAEFVEAVADGHSIGFCGTESQRGSSFWQGVAVPTPGSADCLTPTIAGTWGRIKAIYR